MFIDKLYLVFYAGIGGFIGAALRYGINISFARFINSDFPWATFLINIIGSFILGIITELSNKYIVMKPEIFILLTVGLCGGFTTFSTFLYESYHIMKDEMFLKAIVYGAGSYFLGFIFLYSGILLVRYLFIK